MLLARYISLFNPSVPMRDVFYPLVLVFLPSHTFVEYLMDQIIVIKPEHYLLITSFQMMLHQQECIYIYREWHPHSIGLSFHPCRDTRSGITPRLQWRAEPDPIKTRMHYIESV